MNKPIITQEHRNAAAQLLLDKGWTQAGYYAVDAHGITIDPRAPGACQFCALGALAAVTGLDVDVVHGAFECAGVEMFNDEANSVQDVVEWLRSGRERP